jgi:hypothetical protein
MNKLQNKYNIICDCRSECLRMMLPLGWGIAKPMRLSTKDYKKNPRGWEEKYRARG